MRTSGIPALILVAIASAPANDDGASDSAVSPTATVTWDGSVGLGGDSAGRAAGRALLDAGLELDLESWWGWDRTTAYAGVQALRGRPGGALAGEFQAHSDIDAEPFEHFVGWIETRFPADRVRIRVGRMDANDEFGVAHGADPFLNASAGLSPTISCLPTYPEPRPGIHLIARPSAAWETAVGLHDNDVHPGGGPGGRFWVGELRRKPPGSPLRIAVGAWRHRADAGGAPPTDGTYAVVERRFRGDFLVWASLGRTPDDTVEAREHVAVGATGSGLLPGRTDDRSGLLLTHVDLRAVGGGRSGHETVVELFHRVEPTPWLAIQPDVQWIASSGIGRPEGRSRWIATVRIELTY